MRDRPWLERRLAALRARYFADVRPEQEIDISFGKRALRRLGCLGEREGKTIIRVNGLLALEEVPDFVVDGVLVHELAHFAHGYGAGGTRKYKHAHRGGVVMAELWKRGCAHLESRADEWLGANWRATYALHTEDLAAGRERRREAARDAWSRFHAEVACRSLPDVERQMAQDCRLLGWTARPPRVEWLDASVRHKGITYINRSTGAIRLHGLLAHPDCPIYVVRFGWCYWLAGGAAGRPWPEIVRNLERAGLEDLASRTAQWLSTRWTAFRRRHHPLN